MVTNCLLLIDDGSMSSQLREKNLDRLKYDTDCKIMLISLKCGSLGLNLTSANHVILTDIWWNPAVEGNKINKQINNDLTMIYYRSSCR